MSSNRLTRKQIKEDIRHDHFQDAMTSTLDTLRSHQKQIVTAAVALVAVIVIAALGRWYFDSRATASANALAEVIKTHSAPVDETAAKPDDPRNPSFASVEDRQDRTREALDEVKGGVAADVAELYRARLALDAGDREAAREHWERFLASHEDHILAVQVRMNLLRLDRDEGRGEAVVEELERQLEATSSELPEDLVLYELGETLDTLGRGDDARAYYQRILDDHPASPFSVKAREKTSSS